MDTQSFTTVLKGSLSGYEEKLLLIACYDRSTVTKNNFTVPFAKNDKWLGIQN